jgi:hypothetical protein
MGACTSSSSTEVGSRSPQNNPRNQGRGGSNATGVNITFSQDNGDSETEDEPSEQIVYSKETLEKVLLETIILLEGRTKK